MTALNTIMTSKAPHCLPSFSLTRLHANLRNSDKVFTGTSITRNLKGGTCLLWLEGRWHGLFIDTLGKSQRLEFLIAGAEGARTPDTARFDSCLAPLPAFTAPWRARRLALWRPQNHKRPCNRAAPWFKKSICHWKTSSSDGPTEGQSVCNLSLFEYRAAFDSIRTTGSACIALRLNKRRSLVLLLSGLRLWQDRFWKDSHMREQCHRSQNSRGSLLCSLWSGIDSWNSPRK
jgi:hypothetical protein